MKQRDLLLLGVLAYFLFFKDKGKTASANTPSSSVVDNAATARAIAEQFT